MTAISAASVGVKTMADGTLRITFDVEPSEAGAAFALFGKPGTPAALAALQVGYASVQDSAVSTKGEHGEIVDKPKGGPLSKEAALLCQNQVFHHWLETEHHIDIADEELAAEWIRQICEVKSRAFLDSPVTRDIYIKQVRMPFMLWQRERATA